MTAVKSTQSSKDAIEQAASRWLQAKAAGTLSDLEAAELALWLAASEHHATAFERMGQAWANPSVWSALAILAEEERRFAAPRWFRSKVRIGLVMAAAAAVVAAVFLLEQSASKPAGVLTFATGTAEVRTIALADGSQIHLNGETAIDVRFDQTVRRLDLRSGEIMIEVAHEPRPLQVWVDEAAVTALGTAFNVDRRGDGAMVFVTEGVVEISGGTWAPVPIVAGKAARITTAGVAVAPIDNSSIAWREGVLATSGVSIADLAHALSRYTDREIVVDPEIATKIVSGRFSLHQPDRTLRLLAAAYDLEVREEPDRFVLSRPGL